jgi:hypothetical protein
MFSLCYHNEFESTPPSKTIYCMPVQNQFHNRALPKFIFLIHCLNVPKKVLHINLGTTRLRGRPRNRWQDEVREDGRTVGGEGWQEKVHNREERKKLLRTARNRHILHMSME